MHDLRAILARELVKWPFKARASRLKGSRRDVILQQLAVDDIHDRWYQRLDILGSADEGFDVILEIFMSA